VLAEAAEHSGLFVALHTPQLTIANSSLAAARGLESRTVEIAQTAAEFAREYGQLAVEADALHHAARFGDRTAARDLNNSRASLTAKSWPFRRATPRRSQVLTPEPSMQSAGNSRMPAHFFPPQGRQPCTIVSAIGRRARSPVHARYGSRLNVVASSHR
jgi:hypothetical protein